MSSSLIPLKTRRQRASMHLKSVEAQTSSHWHGEEVRRRVPALVSTTSLDLGVKITRSFTIPPRVASV
ncbi:hypothetical protein TNCV_94931 [Trichonephila clavipes]|nr:hypothetical protein TNCV_94931 [Trichonephila clavipes]